MSAEEAIARARSGQDDLIRCMQMILMRKFSLSETGVSNCARAMLENGEGSRELVTDVIYLRNTIWAAFGVIGEVDELRRA